jgi:dienelactone hydrolase
MRILLIALAGWAPTQEPGPPLPGTQPLAWNDDIASRLVAGADVFLLRQIDRSVEARPAYWKRDPSSPEKYAASLEPNRRRLAKIIGARDPRVPFDGFELVGTTARPALVGQAPGYKIYAARWPAFGDVHGEGLLLVPDAKPVADVVAIPDADQTPEQIAGLADGVAPASQFARRLAEHGCRVIVPALISRKIEPRNGRAHLTHREYVYRPAFEMGRHIVGYEVQKILSAVDGLGKNGAPVGLIGYGEGGWLALIAAALDERIATTVVSGAFDTRQNVWQEPIDRNVFGLLREFGDAELASMIAPRKLVVDAARGPELQLPGKGGAPGRLLSPNPENVRRELERARALTAPLAADFTLVQSPDAFCADGALAALVPQVRPTAPPPERVGSPLDPDARLARQIHELDRHSQRLLVESPYVRQEFFKKLDTSSAEKFKATVEEYRRYFYDEVIGRFDLKPLPPNPRSRRSYDRPKWVGYEVVLDLWPDVIAYGILCLPKDLRAGEKRPVVVCQHGLEGRPQDVVAGDHAAYHDFAARLAEHGFITFAPQNLYIFTDRFRTLQRKANPLGKTLFSIIVPQHQAIVDWLKTLPNVDPQRIGFYGLSYGGKTAMRVPPLVPDYALSICSADFNDWIWKNASTRAPYSYVWTGEYEIFEFDLGQTFNYAEMAALIAPRPFMVERGHFDGVAPDETVGYEFAKVRFLYQARLGLRDRCEIEWFVGPHTINGKGTFDFLHKHLAWPRPAE